MKAATIGMLLSVLICLSAVAAARDKHEWATGTLVSITDSKSSRVYGSSGNVNTIEYVEYRISVLFDGIVYVGSYSPRWVWSYAPTEFVVNDPIEIRIDGKEMYIKRPGKDALKTKIVQRIRQDDHPTTQSSSPK